MGSRTWLAGAAVAGVAVATAVAVYRAQHSREQQRWGLFRAYCTDCHNKDDLAGNVSFQAVTPQSVAEHPEVFEAAVRKLRGHLMPPPGNPQPKPSDADALIATLETSIDTNAKAHPSAGYVPAQRLNRTEYANAVKDLLDVDIDPAEYLPPEIEVKGFTNIAAALSVSPAFVEQYVDAASAVAHLAVGEPKAKVATAFFPKPSSDQTGYVAGMPLGTRGGMKATHTFPADGEYRLTITNLGAGLYPRSLETRHTLVVLIDRHEEWRGDIGGDEDLALIDRGGAPAREEIMKRFMNIPLQVKAGTHEIAVTFIERSRAASDELVSTFTPQQTFSSTGAPRVPGIEGGINLIGPFNSPGLSPTASRKKLFVCEPEVADRERACVEQIASHLARLAFRRPVSQADLDRLMPFYEEGRKGPGGFDEGVELMVTAVLASPDFLYRAVAPRGGAAGGAHALADAEVASRLSFFLWGQGPDDTLLGLAAAGKLSQQDALDEQVRRMLKDPRAAVLVDEFALRWLHVQDLDAIQPDKLLFPEFTDALRGDFAEEIRLFLSSVLLEDKDVRTLLTANYTFVNERLARHYGVPNIVGPQFRRVTLEDPRRFGLLGKGAVLLRTSYGDRTSPVLRGQWVLDKLMGTPPTPPPPGVDTNLTQPPGEKPKTVRARLEQHRTSSVCKSCHGVIDPYGLALENFTATGSWRAEDHDAGAPIDASTELAGGKKVTGPIELTKALLERRDQFVQAFTQKLMMYALGRELEYYDMPEVRAIVRAAAAQDYRFSALVTGIVRSDAFRMQAVVKDDGAGVQASADPKDSARVQE
jgi:mono/diheme cytochrome c family protein